MSVRVEKSGPVFTVILSRPQVKNAVDRPTADALADAFRQFATDEAALVAVLWGEGGSFCSGADLGAVAEQSAMRANRLSTDLRDDGPMGPTRMKLKKPVIAAVSGYAVAGGLELALWCDLRVVEEDAIFGVYCRRYGVPLIDGGTQRLPRLIGLSRAMDMILTGRSVDARQAFEMGLANRVVPVGTCLAEAQKLAEKIAAFPQLCMRSDRLAALEGFSMDFDAAMALEFEKGMEVIFSGETVSGANRFIQGKDRQKP
jgi:enoyl-CoA hydratase